MKFQLWEIKNKGFRRGFFKKFSNLFRESKAPLFFHLVSFDMVKSKLLGFREEGFGVSKEDFLKVIVSQSHLSRLALRLESETCFSSARLAFNNRCDTCFSVSFCVFALFEVDFQIFLSAQRGQFLL